MAVTFIEEEKKQKKLIYLLIIIVLIAIFMLWQGVLKERFSKIKEALTPSPEPKKIEINLEVLKSPILKELQSFEEIKPFEGKIGRENPFLPSK